MTIRSLTVAVFALVLSSAPLAAQEFFIYQTPCQVTVDGNLDVEASVTGVASGMSTDSQSFVTTHPIASTSLLKFNDSGEADANLAMNFVDDCKTNATSSIGGSTGYDFAGDTVGMKFGIGSRRSHVDSITRGLIGGPGNGVVASSDYSIPQVGGAVNVFIPFQVGGGNGGVLTVEDFSFARSDSGATGGSTIAAWQVFSDVNGNCQLDFPQDQALGGDAGIVFPNGTYSAPQQRFNIPRNNYVLWLTYFTSSDETVSSSSCSQSASGASDVSDSVTVKMRLN